MMELRKWSEALGLPLRKTGETKKSVPQRKPAAPRKGRNFDAYQISQTHGNDAVVMTGYRKYANSLPPRGTLDSEKLDYLTWRMQILSAEQIKQDAVLVTETDESTLATSDMSRQTSSEAAAADAASSSSATFIDSSRPVSCSGSTEKVHASSAQPAFTSHAMVRDSDEQGWLNTLVLNGESNEHVQVHTDDDVDAEADDTLAVMPVLQRVDGRPNKGSLREQRLAADRETYERQLMCVSAFDDEDDGEDRLDQSAKKINRFRLLLRSRSSKSVRPEPASRHERSARSQSYKHSSSHKVQEMHAPDTYFLAF